jgi:hypothetical protein
MDGMRKAAHVPGVRTWQSKGGAEPVGDSPGRRSPGRGRGRGRGEGGTPDAASRALLDLDWMRFLRFTPSPAPITVTGTVRLSALVVLQIQ